ncbi:MAG: hypothetical protein QXH27_02075 [Candidatus Micrarchaeia archaeon]
MRFLALVLLIAAAAQARGVQEFVFDFRLENESFSIVELPDASGVYFVGIGGRLVLVEEKEGGYSVLAEPEKIFPLLVAYQEFFGAKLEGAFPRKSELASVRALVLAFNASREPMESKCMRESGLDKFPCFDRESCFKACYTPLCKPLALGFGWPFVENLSRWKNATEALDANASAFFRLFDPLASAPDVPTAREATLARVEELEAALPEAIALVRGMGASAGEIAANPIFDEYVYSFCDPIQFDWSSLLAAKRAAENFTARLAPLAALANASRETSAEGRERARIAFERAQARACANFSERVEAAITELEAEAASASREVVWEGTAEKLAAARSAAGAAGKKCGESEFYGAADAIAAFERAGQELRENLLGLLEQKSAVAKKIGVLYGRFSSLKGRAEDFGVDASGTEAELVSANSTLSAPLNESALAALSGLVVELESELNALEKEVARREEAARARDAALKALAVVLVLTAALTIYYMRVVRARARR